jgi:hypothetical protein
VFRTRTQKSAECNDINIRNQRLRPKYNFGEKKIIEKNTAIPSTQSNRETETYSVKKYKNYRENGKQPRGSLLQYITKDKTERNKKENN